MNLFNLPWLLIGAVIGLVVGFLLDYFFWRRRRVCSEREQELSVQVNTLRGDLDKRVAAYGVLEGDLATANGRISSLEGDLSARDIEIDGLRGRADELSVFESNFEGTGWTLGGFLGGLTASGLWNRWRDKGGDIDYDAEFSTIGNLEADLSARDGQIRDLEFQVGRIGDLEADIEARNGRIAGLEADLRARDLELEGLRAQVGGMQAKVDEVADFEAKLGSRGLTLGSFFGGFTASSLWNRWSGDGDASMDIDAELGRIDTLEADLRARDLEIEGLQAKIGGMQAKVDEVADFEAKLGSRGLTLGGFLGGFTASSLWNRWSADDADAVLDIDAELGRLDLLEADVDAKDQRIFELETQLGRLVNTNVDLGDKAANLDLMTGELDGKDARIFELETQLGRLAGANVELGSQAADLNLMTGELDGKDARIFELETQLNRDANMSVELSDASARLAALEAELAEKSDYLERLDADADAMVDLQAEMLAKNARLGELEADLEAKNQSILVLEKDLIRLQMLEAELADRSYQVEGMQAQVETDIVDLEAKDQRIFELETQLSRLASANVDLGEAGVEANALVSDLDGKDQRIFELETQLGRLVNANVDLGSRNLEFSSLAAGAAGAAAGAMASDDSGRVAELEAEVNRLNLLLASQKSPDDLTKVWGIGPKIAGLLNDNGITTFEQLANTDVDTISGYMEAAGSRYRLSDPKILGTWSQQATMAADGDWSGLKAYQATLKRTEVANPLRKIWGVGAKTEGLLNSAGVNNFEDLLGATEASLDSAIDSAKGYYPGMDRDGIFRSWMEQARLGVDSKWAQLRGFQQQYRTERRRDDLTRLWGIGPGLEAILNRRGINSFAELNDLSSDQAAEIVKEAGLSKAQLPDDYYNVWMTQSNFAVNGDWDGRENFMRGLRKDDLKLIWGIGPKIEGVLNNNGIMTFEALSITDPDRIDEMLEEAGSRFNLSTENLHETWISQARLADSDDWVAFQALYDSLTWDNVQDEE